MPEEITPFAEYEVPGVGTVIDPEGEPGYRVRTADGRVVGYPAQSGAPSEANAAADLAYAIANPVLAAATAAQIYADQQALGYVDIPTGLKLKTTENAQAKFTSQVTLLQLALSAGAITTATPQTFWDYADVEQTLTTGDLFALMLRYGMHCKTIFDQYAP